MTGFGQGIFTSKNYQVFAEVRSVNHRFLNLNLRIPQEISPLEADIRKSTAENFLRGSIDVSISYQKNEPARFEINHFLIEGFLKVMNEIKENYNIAGSIDLNTIARLPQVISLKREEITDELRCAVFEALDKAFKQLQEMQTKEGKAIEKTLNESLEKIESLAAKIDELASLVHQDYFQLISKRISELISIQLDEARLAQEVAYLAERADITEENSRIKIHLSQIRSLVASQDRNIGKRLDFIAQELNRETNTILSKTPNIRIKELALEIKGEVEKIREQVQNVE